MKDLSFRQPPQYAIVSGDTTPLGKLGSLAWSTTVSRFLIWNGTAWAEISSNDYTTVEKTKLAGIATGATANSTDSYLLNRANHTGTQLMATISDNQGQVVSNPWIIDNAADYGWSIDTYTTPGQYLFSTTNNGSFTGCILDVKTTGGYVEQILSIIPQGKYQARIFTPGSPGSWSAWTSQTALMTDITWTNLSGIPSNIGSTTVRNQTNYSTANRIPSYYDTSGTIINQADFYDMPQLGGPVAPAAGMTRFAAMSVSGFPQAVISGSDGLNRPLQTSLYSSHIALWTPSSGSTVASSFGTTWTSLNTSSSTQSHPTLSSTSVITRTPRASFNTSTTVNSATGITGKPQFWRGNATNAGGFFFKARFCLETTVASARIFIGLNSSTASLSANPSSMINIIGIGKDSTDTTWQFICKGTGSSTKVNTSITFNTTDLYDFYIWAAPNATTVYLTFINVGTGVAISSNYAMATNLPVNTTFMAPYVGMQCTTSSSVMTLSLNKIYCQSDY